MNGFKLSYSKGRLSHTRPIGSAEVRKIPKAKQGGEDDLPIFVYCSGRGIYMDFKPGATLADDSWWVCPECKRRTRESTVMHQFEKENELFQQRFVVDNDYEEYW